MQTVKIEDCAVVDQLQLTLLNRWGGLNPWSYKDENPFELTKQITQQEEAMRKQFGTSD